MANRNQRSFENITSEQLLLINILNDMYNENIRQINNYCDAINGLNEANNNIRATLVQILNINARNRSNNSNSNSNSNVFNQSHRSGNYFVPEYIVPLASTLPFLNNSGQNNSRFLESFFSPVEVYPTQSQIEAATRRVKYCDIVSPVNTRCPISLETFNDNDMVSVIRVCGHIFKTEDLNTWFRSNCKCPICRYDIRNYNSSSAETAFFSQDPSGNSSSSSTQNIRANSSTERMISNVLNAFLSEPIQDSSGNVLYNTLFRRNTNYY
jgi:hypothetical protein